ncbi:conserved hypothetical protein [Aspergillus terreus NIH2624]|uniref:Arylsulfatase n=1 Tax=Aspergillus terreus (strain NIH 2624 / FGSC A1156) TaxID=341663 RepID=Q0CAQ7_ASPTN|nr:uncharacterized protein ATEG_09227 [Aspergillus terreus NIH2624]EAU30364.1 conserved hypothetical protein [Aspergillus terreus NIH2624]
MKWSLGALLFSGLCLAAKRPNILFILTDDQDNHMGGIDSMSRLQESIISKGAAFEKHFCTVAICCPSRANLWTGRMPHNNNITDVAPPYGGYPQVVKLGWNDNYLPLWMQDAGYNTYYVGKLWNYQNIDNYNDPPPRGFNGSEISLDPYTYQYYNSMMTRNGGEPVSYAGQYITDVMTEKAHGFLDEALADERPWMMTVAPVAPHSNGTLEIHSGVFWQSQPEYAPRHAHMFKDYKIPRDASFNAAIDGGVSWIGKLDALNDSVIEYHDEYQRCRLRSLQAVDEMVESLVSRLEEAGVLDTTYIFYSTDNGYHISQHRLAPGKECGFDTDIHIPLYVRGPGIPENKTFSAVTSHTDLAPTFLRIAGTTTDGLDGKPLPFTMEESCQSKTEHIGVEYWGVNLPEGVNGYRKVPLEDGSKHNINVYHNNTYKGLRLVGDEYSLYYSVWCSNEVELYDLTTDPYQITNLASNRVRFANHTVAGRPLHQVINRLDALMMVVKSCKEDSCREPWKELHPGGYVENLKAALSPAYDAFYARQPKVHFRNCEEGYLISAEGAQSIHPYKRKQRRIFDYGDHLGFFS